MFSFESVCGLRSVYLPLAKLCKICCCLKSKVNMFRGVFTEKAPHTMTILEGLEEEETFDNYYPSSCVIHSIKELGQRLFWLGIRIMRQWQIFDLQTPFRISSKTVFSYFKSCIDSVSSSMSIHISHFKRSVGHWTKYIIYVQ